MSPDNRVGARGSEGLRVSTRLQLVFGLGFIAILTACGTGGPAEAVDAPTATPMTPTTSEFAGEMVLYSCKETDFGPNGLIGGVLGDGDGVVNAPVDGPGVPVNRGGGGYEWPVRISMDEYSGRNLDAITLALEDALLEEAKGNWGDDENPWFTCEVDDTISTQYMDNPANRVTLRLRDKGSSDK